MRRMFLLSKYPKEKPPTLRRRQCHRRPECPLTPRDRDRLERLYRPVNHLNNHLQPTTSNPSHCQGQRPVIPLCTHPSLMRSLTPPRSHRRSLHLAYTQANGSIPRRNPGKRLRITLCGREGLRQRDTWTILVDMTRLEGRSLRSIRPKCARLKDKLLQRLREPPAQPLNTIGWMATVPLLRPSMVRPSGRGTILFLPTRILTFLLPITVLLPPFTPIAQATTARQVNHRQYHKHFRQDSPRGTTALCHLKTISRFDGQRKGQPRPLPLHHMIQPLVRTTWLCRPL
jgi:hypothetical protein